MWDVCCTSHMIMIWAAGETGGAEFLGNCKEISLCQETKVGSHISIQSRASKPNGTRSTLFLSTPYPTNVPPQTSGFEDVIHSFQLVGFSIQNPVPAFIQALGVQNCPGSQLLGSQLVQAPKKLPAFVTGKRYGFRMTSAPFVTDNSRKKMHFGLFKLVPSCQGAVNRHS